MSRRNVLPIGVLAGLAGGAAEVAWVAGHSALTGASGAAVARGVTAAFLPGLAQWPIAIGLGIALHMLLAVALGVALAAAVSAATPRRIGNWPRGTLVVLTLGTVWALNVLAVLPVLEPGSMLLPLAATLASKLLFDVGAAAPLRARRTTRF